MDVCKELTGNADATPATLGSKGPKEMHPNVHTLVLLELEVRTVRKSPRIPSALLAHEW